MGNANGREEGADGVKDDHHHPSGGGRSNGELGVSGNHALRTGRVASSESMANTTPPGSPRRSVSPILFASQVIKFSLCLSYIYVYIINEQF